jgi:uncharacterized Tic20 family protein
MADYDDDYAAEDVPAEEPRRKKGSSKDDRLMAMFCHLGGVIGSILVPLIIWLIKKEESRYIDYHGKEALNFQITMLIGHVIGAATICFTFGLVALAVWVIALVYSITAAMAANRGEYYRYPITIRFIQ